MKRTKLTETILVYPNLMFKVGAAVYKKNAIRVARAHNKRVVQFENCKKMRTSMVSNLFKTLNGNTLRNT